jgi:hypothetical protein
MWVDFLKGRNMSTSRKLKGWRSIQPNQSQKAEVWTKISARDWSVFAFKYLRDRKLNGRKLKWPIVAYSWTINFDTLCNIRPFDLGLVIYFGLLKNRPRFFQPNLFSANRLDHVSLFLRIFIEKYKKSKGNTCIFKSVPKMSKFQASFRLVKVHNSIKIIAV